MNVRHVVAALCAAGFVAAPHASAQVTPVGEFAGELFESFENIFAPGAHAGPIPIFGGAGTLNDTITGTCVITVNWWGPAGEVLAFNGNFLGGTIVGSALFEFQTPVTAFGGHFTTIGMLPDGDVIFRDASGGVIASLGMTIVPAEWTWQGWQSTVPISSIEIIGANVPGMSVQMDDLQVVFVPAPASALAFAGVGGLLCARRRRR